ALGQAASRESKGREDREHKIVLHRRSCSHKSSKVPAGGLPRFGEYFGGTVLNSNETCQAQTGQGAKGQGVNPSVVWGTARGDPAVSAPPGRSRSRPCRPCRSSLLAHNVPDRLPH